MTRLSKPNEEVRKGAWDAEEDEKLRKYVETYGTGHWRSVGKKAGLQRCGKSCRLRWTNYLRPDIRHGSFSLEEEDLIVQLHAAHGSRWSLIAAQMQGRTDNDIKNHWNTRLKKKLCDLGIDPVTHKPIAELLRDLAGTMAQCSGAGIQVAEAAARRCFRDSLVNKAVQECGKNNPAALVPQFTNQSINVGVVSNTPEIHHPSDNIVQRFSPKNSGNSHSMDESSSSEEALSRGSASPPLSTDLEHSSHHKYEALNRGQNQNQGATGTVVESSFGQIAYLPSAQMQNEAHSSNFQEPGSNSELFSSRNCNQSVGPFRSVQPVRTDHTRWLSSRSALPQGEFLNAGAAQLPLSRFGSELQSQLGESHGEVSYMQGISDVTKPQAIASGAGKLDIRINLGITQQGSSQENFGHRSFSGPLISPPNTSGYNSLMDITTPHALSGYAGQYNAGNWISPNSVNLTSFNSPLAGTPTGIRFHEFEAQSPRMVLWDFQE